MSIITPVTSPTDNFSVGNQQYNTNSTQTAPSNLRLYVAEDNFSKASLDPDLWQAILSVKSCDLGVVQQTLMLDILLAMASIRKQNMELWQKQAIMAFEAGTLAAEHQKEQARLQAITTAVNASASIIQASVELGAAAATAMYARSQVKAIQDKADSLNWDMPASARTPATPAPGEAPPPYSLENKLRDVNGEEIEMGELPTKKGKGLDPADEAAPQIDQTRKAEYITDAQKNMYTKADMYSRLATALATLISSAMKGSTASTETDAGQEQAEATIQQALQTYLMNQSQFSQSYAQEIQQYIAGILEYLKNVEQARHQAASSVSNV